VGDVNGEAGARQLFVEPSDPEVPGPAALAALDATPLNAGTLRQALGVADEREALQLLRWVRGQDVDDEDGDGDIAEAREWLLGEVLHSRPLPINYGAVDGYTRENPNIHIAFGAGDGALHILENTDRAGNESGAELLAFYPRELLPLLRARRHNTGSSRPMRYGVDGAAAVFTEDRNGDGNLDHVDGDKVYLFFGLRRGGTSYFALDISDPRATPVLLWRISRTRGGDFDELGLSFSPPLVTRVRYRGEVTDALVFAAGYNGGWTADAADRVGKDAGAADDDVGNAVYIVELATGELIWKAVRGATGSISNTRYQHAGLIDSIPSGVTALVSGSGIAHRLYAGDSGGAVWRLDLPQGDSIDHRRDNWSISKLAELGEDGITDDRRFFHAPELVESVDENGAFDGVIIASGDRAHPGRREVINYLFYLKDRAISSGDRSVRVRRPQTLAGLPERSDCLGNDADPESCRAPLTPGWKLRLRAVGEKGLSTPLVDAGRLFFSTFIPSPPGACGPPIGQGVLYQLNLADASSQPGRTRDQFLGPGIPSGAIVTGDAILLPALATGSLTGPEMNSPEILLPRRSGRPRYLYWRQSGVDDR
jgi:type IV pilus assembly protein PilY1